MLFQNGFGILNVLVPCLELHLHGFLHKSAEGCTGLLVHVVQKILVGNNDIGHDQMVGIAEIGRYFVVFEVVVDDFRILAAFDDMLLDGGIDIALRHGDSDTTH